MSRDPAMVERAAMRPRRAGRRAELPLVPGQRRRPGGRAPPRGGRARAPRAAATGGRAPSRPQSLELYGEAASAAAASRGERHGIGAPQLATRAAAGAPQRRHPAAGRPRPHVRVRRSSGCWFSWTRVRLSAARGSEGPQEFQIGGSSLKVGGVRSEYH
eukprot:gene13973-biopygen5731